MAAQTYPLPLAPPRPAARPPARPDRSLREIVIADLRSYFEPEQQSFAWNVALRGQKEKAAELAQIVRQLLAQARHLLQGWVWAPGVLAAG